MARWRCLLPHGAEGAAAEDVKMEVRDHLAAIGAGIDDQAIASLAEALLLGQGGSAKEEPAQQSCLLPAGLGNAGDMLPGDDQNMGRRPRMNVPKGNNIRVLIDDVARSLAAGDLAEDAATSCYPRPPILRRRERGPYNG